jgi:hypothetical protein
MHQGGRKVSCLNSMGEREVVLFRSILGALRGIRDEIHAIREYQKANRTQNDTPLPVELRPNPSLPIAVSEYYEAEQKDRNSKWKRYRPWLEVVGVSVAVSLAILTFCTLRQVKKQADAAQRQLEATGRAWMKISVAIDQPITFDKSGLMRMFFKVSMTNVGKSAAMNIGLRIDCRLQSLKSRMPEAPVIAQTALCKPTRPNEPFTLFPNDTESVVIERYFTTSDIAVHTTEYETPAQAHVGSTTHILPPFVVGCVDYGVATVPGNHQTGFVYYFGRRSPQTYPIGKFMGMIVVGETLPIEDIDITRWTIGGGWYAY